MKRLSNNSFKFIDLFAGIGGIRLAFESTGGECVFSAEWDKYAQKTYAAFFGECPDFSLHQTTEPPGDISQLKPVNIPDYDILTGGFPCQPFSLAGVSKKNSLGRPHGFDDPTQGTLFFDVKRIIKRTQPKAFLLENVKNLLRHDKGNTFEIIRQTLEKDLKYDLFVKVIDGAGWVPQHRERIYLVGFHKSLGVDENEFVFPSPPPPSKRKMLIDVLQASVDPKYTLGKGTWATLERHKKHHKEAGNGFGYGLIKLPINGQITRTISARYHKDGAEVLIDQGPRSLPRRLTPLECARLMGFPKKYQKYFDPSSKKFNQPVSDTQAYRQFGNSVVVPVITQIAKEMIKTLENKNAVGIKTEN